MLVNLVKGVHCTFVGSSTLVGKVIYMISPARIGTMFETKVIVYSVAAPLVLLSMVALKEGNVFIVVIWVENPVPSSIKFMEAS